MRLRPWREPALRPEPLARAAVVGDLVRTSLDRDGECTWRARGASMAGAIRHGDAVRLVPATRIDEGDVVMATLADDRLVIHRVRRVEADRLILRGDSCWRDDPPVPLRDVIAKLDPCPQPTWRAKAYRMVPA